MLPLFGSSAPTDEAPVAGRRTRPLPGVEIMLAAGCLGGLEMIVASYLWLEITETPRLWLLQPGGPAAVLGVVGLLVGIAGGFVFLGRLLDSLIRRKRSFSWLAAALFVLLCAEVPWVFLRYAGV